jgi:hypothetical protein
LYMWKTLKPKKAVYARIKHPNRKWRFLYEKTPKTKTPKWRWQPVRTSVRVFVSFVYIQVSTRTTPKNEYSSFYMYRTPKTKKAVYTRIKHPNRKWRFVHVGSIQNENSCFCT